MAARFHVPATSVLKHLCACNCVEAEEVTLCTRHPCSQPCQNGESANVNKQCHVIKRNDLIVLLLRTTNVDMSTSPGQTSVPYEEGMKAHTRTARGQFPHLQGHAEIPKLLKGYRQQKTEADWWQPNCSEQHLARETNLLRVTWNLIS